MKASVKEWTIENLVNAYLSRDITPNQQYQRGLAWTTEQKQLLIDSILRGYKLPLFYIHQDSAANTFGEILTKRWIIDGQQRLSAMVDFKLGRFALRDPRRERRGEILPSAQKDVPSWAGLRYSEFPEELKTQFDGETLHVVVIEKAVEGEIEDLFVRLQAGTPLTPQQKRDAWPGDFVRFVIEHAGKLGHKDSRPHRFFDLMKMKKPRRAREDDAEDELHYIDDRADTRKFFSQIAMIIMLRERDGLDFVDVKGSNINEFYLRNHTLHDDDPAVLRVKRVLDETVRLKGFPGSLGGLSLQWGLHTALAIDSLLQGSYVDEWRNVFLTKLEELHADVSLARKSKEGHLYHHFALKLAGSGSDTADKIRERHAVFMEELYRRLSLRQKDPKRLFDPIEREIIWVRDGKYCRRPSCRREIPFNEATVHHVVEHTTGGKTSLENGVLICADCAPLRNDLQSLQAEFETYLSGLIRERDRRSAA